MEVDGTVSIPNETDPLVKRKNVKMPTCVKYILAMEACERFSYYGLKTVLPVYFKNELGYSEDSATAIVTCWKGVLYLLPVAGAIIADMKWGKYNTIWRLSVVYVLGGFLLAFTSIPQWKWGAFTGLALLAIGAGGIKPCVSSFGGDQFLNDDAALHTFFSWFYLAINLGSLPAQIITPVLRSEVAYSVAFLLPACLILIATVLFVRGQYDGQGYRILPPRGSVIVVFLEIVWVGLKDYFSGAPLPEPPSPKQEQHWVDGAYRTHDQETVDQAKRVLHVLYLFLPLPMFWALYDQYDTRWTYQAETMDRDLGGWEIPEESVQMVNPLLVLILIPFFLYVAYPGFERCTGVEPTPLKKISCGLFIAGFSFIAAAILQNEIDSRCDDFCDEDEDEGCNNGDCIDPDGHQVSVWWQLPQYLIVTIAEVLVVVTSYEFAYSQAPTEMNSVILAACIMTTSIGNFMIAIVAASSPFNSQVTEYLFFSALMFVVAAIFIPMARGYTDLTKETPPTIQDAEDLVPSTEELPSQVRARHSYIDQKVSR